MPNGHAAWNYVRNASRNTLIAVGVAGLLAFGVGAYIGQRGIYPPASGAGRQVKYGVLDTPPHERRDAWTSTWQGSWTVRRLPDNHPDDWVLYSRFGRTPGKKGYVPAIATRGGRFNQETRIVALEDPTGDIAKKFEKCDLEASFSDAGSLTFHFKNRYFYARDGTFEGRWTCR
ncbi:MAG: hypothetical protein HY368_00040 [Candidatus Aenigmarchaeota archaeon]|nr:hypothetical protein [Candidatus Aenigmarchaeota archaeon]